MESYSPVFFVSWVPQGATQNRVHAITSPVITPPVTCLAGDGPDVGYMHGITHPYYHPHLLPGNAHNI